MIRLPVIRLLRLQLALWLVCSLALASGVERHREIPIIDCHVHLWDIARPEGLGWIKKDDRLPHTPSPLYVQAQLDSAPSKAIY